MEGNGVKQYWKGIRNDSVRGGDKGWTMVDNKCVVVGNVDEGDDGDDR